MPNDMDIGIRFICRGFLNSREHVVSPVSGSYVGLGSWASKYMNGRRGGGDDK